MRKSALDIIIRYAILILAGLFNLWIFYVIFTPLTVYPIFIILNLFYDAVLVTKDIILVNNTVPIELIEACIAGSAFYLLLILNLATREIKTSTRIKIIVSSFLAFLVLNVIRIVVLSVMAVSNSGFFDITHLVFWYALSTIFVIAIWFKEVRFFKIKSIPFYSDIKFLLKRKKS